MSLHHDWSLIKRSRFRWVWMTKFNERRSLSQNGSKWAIFSTRLIKKRNRARNYSKTTVFAFFISTLLALSAVYLCSQANPYITEENGIRLNGENRIDRQSRKLINDMIFEIYIIFSKGQLDQKWKKMIHHQIKVAKARNCRVKISRKYFCDKKGRFRSYN